jgi:hypothetical protein
VSMTARLPPELLAPGGTLGLPLSDRLQLASESARAKAKSLGRKCIIMILMETTTPGD